MKKIILFIALIALLTSGCYLGTPAKRSKPRFESEHRLMSVITGFTGGAITGGLGGLPDLTPSK